MKPSKYNFIVQHNKKTFIYNTLNSALVEISPLFKSILENENICPSDFAPYVQNFLKEMEQNGFIVDESINEIKILKNITNKIKYSNDTLDLVIAPTMLCNFNCPYCFEQDANNEYHTSNFMSKETQENLINFVEKKIKGKKILRVTWYGGEPMLGYNMIFDLSEKLIKIAEKNEIKYQSNMITNGYIIGEKPYLIDKLISSRITTYQITLDGTPEIHNTRRCLKENPNKDTFSTIMNGIVELNSKGLRVNVRINVDHKNWKNAEKLLEIFEKKGLQSVGVYIAPVYDVSSKSCEGSNCSCLNNNDIFKISDDFDIILKEKGFEVFANSLNLYLRCSANSLTSFIIDPDGDFYKCFWEIGNKNSCCGSLSNEKPGKLQRFKTINYMTWEPFDFPECLDCRALPVCMGGCLDRAINKNNGNPDCPGQDNMIKHIENSIAIMIK